MSTKHFLKALFIFSGMIIFGLVGVFLVSYLDQKEDLNKKQTTEVAK